MPSYGEADIRALRFVRRTRDFGFSVAETAAVFRLWQDEGRASGDVERLTLRHAAALEARAAELLAASRQLRHLADRCGGGSEPPCPIIDELARVEAASPSHPGAEERR